MEHPPELCLCFYPAVDFPILCTMVVYLIFLLMQDDFVKLVDDLDDGK